MTYDGAEAVTIMDIVIDIIDSDQKKMDEIWAKEKNPEVMA